MKLGLDVYRIQARRGAMSKQYTVSDHAVAIVIIGSLREAGWSVNAVRLP